MNRKSVKEKVLYGRLRILSNLFYDIIPLFILLNVILGLYNILLFYTRVLEIPYNPC